MSRQSAVRDPQPWVPGMEDRQEAYADATGRVTYPFPLANGSVAFLQLPVRYVLTEHDATRLGAYAASLVIPRAWVSLTDVPEKGRLLDALTAAQRELRKINTGQEPAAAHARRALSLLGSALDGTEVDKNWTEAKS